MVIKYVFVLIKTSEGFNPDDGLTSFVVSVYADENLAKCALSVYEELSKLHRNSLDYRVSYSLEKFPLYELYKSE